MLYSPCLYREESSIWTNNACGIGGASLSKYDLNFEHASVVLVAAGHPEWAVSAYVDQECKDSRHDGGHCVFWKAAEYETKIVHIDDVCEGYRCDSLP